MYKGYYALSPTDRSAAITSLRTEGLTLADAERFKTYLVSTGATVTEGVVYIPVSSGKNIEQPDAYHELSAPAERIRRGDNLWKLSPGKVVARQQKIAAIVAANTHNPFIKSADKIYEGFFTDPTVVITRDQEPSASRAPVSSHSVSLAPATAKKAEDPAASSLVEKSLVSAARRAFRKGPVEGAQYFVAHILTGGAMEEAIGPRDQRAVAPSVLQSLTATTIQYYIRTRSLSAAVRAGLSSGAGSAVFEISGLLYDAYCDALGIPKNDEDRLAFQMAPTVAEKVGKFAAKVLHNSPNINGPTAPAIYTEGLHQSELGYSTALFLLGVQRKISRGAHAASEWVGEGAREQNFHPVVVTALGCIVLYGIYAAATAGAVAL